MRHERGVPRPLDPHEQHAIHTVWDKFKNHYGHRMMPSDEEMTAYFNNRLEELGITRQVKVKCDPPIPFEMRRVISVTAEDLPRIAITGII